MQKGKSRSAPDAYLVGPGSFPQTYQQNCENPMGALQSTAYDANAALAICRGAGSALGRRFGGGSSHPTRAGCRSFCAWINEPTAYWWVYCSTCIASGRQTKIAPKSNV